jgi:2-oxo-4-hydroxy-4-carboxy-5-ureidoimidazoline decarboxylase
VTLDEINALDREAFTVRLGHVAEDSPWVAYGAWDYRPFAGPLELVAAFRGAIARAEDERQIALIEAHAAPQGDADDAYRERFGFPFVLCTYQRSADSQLAAYEQRLTHEPELEMAIALDEVVKIIRLRIADLLAI